MKKSLKLGLIFALLTVSVFLGACKKEKDLDGELFDFDSNITGNEGGKTEYQDVPTVVTKFVINFYSDMAPEQYELRRTENGAKYYIIGYNDDPILASIDEKYMEDIDEWVDTYDIRKWDGFSMTDSGVLDGSGFNIEIELETGESIYASGSNVYPDNFSEAAEAIRRIIEEAQDEALVECYSNDEGNEKYASSETLTDEMFDEFATYPWQKAYKKVLENSLDKASIEEGGEFLWQGYFLYDMDKDSIPELFIKTGTCEADYLTKVYFFDEGEAVEAGEIASGHTSYYTYPSGNGILEFYSHMASGAIIRTCFDGTSLVLPGNVIYEDDLYETLQTDPDADYTPVNKVVRDASPIGFSSLKYIYGLLEYDTPLLASRGNECTEEDFEDEVNKIIGTKSLFYGVTADNMGNDKLRYYGRRMGMIELYEREGLFENSEGSAVLDEVIYDDFNGDGKMEALAIFDDGASYNKAVILFAYQNGQMYGYITSPMYFAQIETENGHIYMSADHSPSSELVFKYYLDQCSLFYEDTDRMVIGKAAQNSLTLFRQDVRGDKGELAVAYLGNAGLYSEKTLYDLLKSVGEKYYDEEFMWHADRIHCVKQPGEEVYMLVPAKDNYTISVYEVVWGDDTPDEMPKRGKFLYETEPGDIVIVRGNQSDIISNLEIVVDMDGEELIYQPCLSLEDGKLQRADKVVDFTRYYD